MVIAGYRKKRQQITSGQEAGHRFLPVLFSDDWPTRRSFSNLE